MEAIPESADDGSELESSEGGSEEWSDDEDEDEDDDGNSSQVSSSTASTPVRCQSLPESLSGSPTRASTSNDNPTTTARSSFFPPHAFGQDFSFVLEALDFHFGSSREGTTDNSSNHDDSSNAKVTTRK